MSSAYTRDILQLAMEAGLYPRLQRPSVSVQHRSPICGSRITLDLSLNGQATITSTGFDLSACAFGQASSVLFAKHAVRLDHAVFSSQVNGIRLWLDGKYGLPWPGFEALEPVRPLSARHGAVLLPFEAALKAFMIQPAA